MSKCKAAKNYDQYPRLPIFELCVYNRCLNLHMMRGQSPGPKWLWSWPLVKMAPRAHVLHFECITEMFLKTNLAGRDLSCHVTGISNMQKSVHEKTDKTSLVRQVDFSRGFMQRSFLYTSDPCQCIEQHIVIDETSKISKLVTFVTISVSSAHSWALTCSDM